MLIYIYDKMAATDWARSFFLFLSLSFWLSLHSSFFIIYFIIFIFFYHFRIIFNHFLIIFIFFHFLYIYIYFYFFSFFFSVFHFFRCFLLFLFSFVFIFVFFLNSGCIVFSFIRKRYQDPMAPSWFFHSLICAFHFGSWRQAWPDYGRPEGSPKEVKMRRMARLGLGLGQKGAPGGSK